MMMSPTPRPTMAPPTTSGMNTPPTPPPAARCFVVGAVRCEEEAVVKRLMEAVLAEGGEGLVLRRAVKVAQNGAFNKLRGVYNPLEFCQVPRISTPPTSESL